MDEQDPLDAVRGAAGTGQWKQAEALLDAAGTAGTSAAGLELRAQIAYANGDFEGATAAWEALCSLNVAQGDPVEGARAAGMLAMFLLIDTGLMATVRGWVRRAERLLVGQAESPAHAIVAVVRTYERFMCGDMASVRVEAARAIDLGDRLGVTPASVIGRVATARVTILDGDLDDGLGQLDEIATWLMSGDVDPLTTGMMYCELICAAQGLAMHDRAVEWTEMMERWRHGAAFGGISGRCRVHRAELLRVSGTCDEAEDEALAACEELRPWMRREFGWPLVELGNIRLRKGDLAGAEEAFLAAHERAWSPQPGLALLRLAQGDVAAASAMIADEIAHPFDVPWKERPPFGDLRLAPLFEAQSEIAAAAGDATTARSSAEALARIADAYPSRSLQAAAVLADARAALVAGEVDAALAAATGAVALWGDLGAPYETAMARLVLAEARDAAGQHDGARLERQAAQRVFAAFGAVGKADECAAHLAGTPTRAARAERSATTTAAATFRRSGDTRTVELAGHAVTVKDLKGLRYVERLVAAPGREFHALDLVAVEAGSLPAGPMGDADLVPAGTGLAMIDEQARAAYRKRLAEVDDDIDDATLMNDPARRELAERDREYLLAELSRAVGLGDRIRSSGSDAERARTAVTRSIRYALEQLAEHHPAAAAHLQQRIRTGAYCSYSADPIAPVDWAT